MTEHETDSLGRMEQRVAELEAQLRAQQERLDAALEREVTRPVAVRDPDAIEGDASGTNRRDLLRHGVLAVGVGVAGAAALARPAAAADTDPVTIGAVNTASSRTDLRIDGATPLGHNVFTAQDGTFGGSSVPAALGGYATGDRVGNGVYGYTNGEVSTDTYSGYALVAACDTRGTASRAPLWMFPSGGEPASDSIDHRAGELVVSSNGRLWYCTAAGTPGAWEEISGDRALIDDVEADIAQLQSDVAGIASGPTFLPTSQRAFDSRPGEPGDGGTKGTFAADENRVVDLTVDTDLPAGARAAIVHLTLAGSASAGGFLSVYSAAVADLAPPGFSSLNWASTGQFDANTTVTAISPAGAVKVFALNPAHVAIDVIGYYA